MHATHSTSTLDPTCKEQHGQAYHHAPLAAVSALNAEDLVSDALPLIAIPASSDSRQHHHHCLPRPWATHTAQT